jgi:serine/threonine protein phosphatase PrpC
MNYTLDNNINENNNHDSYINNCNKNDITFTSSEQRNIVNDKSYSFIGNTNISLIPEKVFLLPKYSISNKYSKNVYEFSYQEDQNITFKQNMEDKAKTITSFNSNPHNILFTLFDGHGGDYVSSYLQMNYDKFLRQSMNLYPNNIPQCLIDSFIQIDNTLQQMNCVRAGSTGCVLFITQERGKKVLYCANIGDTRCTLFTPSKIERLSYDHRACDLNERERIYNNGGFVVKGRVMGRLMLTRTFGDFELKNFGVISKPFVYRKELDENEHNDQFVVMACDGIWDVLNEEGIRQCIVNICNVKENLKKNVTSTICDELIQSALAEGAWDNLSVLAVKL